MFLEELYEKSSLLPCFFWRLLFSPQCHIGTSAQLLSKQKLMTLILNTALNTQINSVITLGGNWLLIIWACLSEWPQQTVANATFLFQWGFSKINLNVSFLNVWQYQNSILFVYLSRWNLMPLIWCLVVVTSSLCSWLRLRLTVLLRMSGSVWPSMELFSHWKPLTQAYVNLLPPAAAYPYHNDTNPSPLPCFYVTLISVVICSSNGIFFFLNPGTFRTVCIQGLHRECEFSARV